MNASGRTVSSALIIAFGGQGFRMPTVEDLMPARLPRLDGVEHADGCPAAGKALAFDGSSSSFDGTTTTTRFAALCESCGLVVQLSAWSTPGELVPRQARRSMVKGGR